MSIRAGGAGASARGQSLVETALVMPVFLALLIGVFDFGRVIWSHDTAETAAREAARYAVVHGGTVLTACPTGPDYLARTCDGLPFGATSATVAVAAGWAGPDSVVTVCYGADCSGDTNAPGATNRRGTPVTVRVITRVDLLIGRLLSLAFGGSSPGAFTVEGSATMLVNT